MEAGIPRRKSARCLYGLRSGEFEGSAWLAARSPITPSMEIARGAIERQSRKNDPTAFAARREDRARVKAEATAVEASGKNMESVFVERGGSSSAKRAALGKLQAKLYGMSK
jgi:hypothetical protein